jgi:hypothetical protein
VAIAHRRAEQEAEWQSLLSGQKAAHGSRASYASTSTDVTKTTSIATAGIKTQDAAMRLEANRRTEYGRTCILLAPGDNVPRKPPLPLERPSRVNPPGEADYEKYRSADGSERLARLLQMDMRP